MTAAAIRARLWDVVPDVLRRDPRSAKEIARAAGMTPRSVENIRQRLTLPSAASLLALERACPELRAEINRLRGLEADCDPEAERLVVELSRAAMKILEQRASRVRKQGENDVAEE